MASTPYPAHLNRACSPQLREEVAFFQQWGYLIVDDALTSSLWLKDRLIAYSSDEAMKIQYAWRRRGQQPAETRACAPAPTSERSCGGSSGACHG